MQKYMIMFSLIIIFQANAICAQAEFVPDKQFDWKLTGNEMLVELMDLEGNNAIYAIDPFADKPKPKLLIKGGRRPEWSPNHRLFSYFYGSFIWIAQIDGRAVRLPNNASEININPYEPPIHWLSNGGYVVKYSFESLGTSMLFSLNLFTNLNDLSQLDTKLFLDSMKCWPEPKSGEKLKWEDIMAVRNLDMSPDGKHYLAQMAPLAPMDLRDNESKIYIIDHADNDEEAVKGWYSDIGVIKTPPRRLTSSDEHCCEVNPICSPDGQWIAFTAIHLDKCYTAPVVCRPDGSDYTELLPKDSSTLGMLWPIEEEWLPVSSWDGKITEPTTINTSFNWGNPYAFPVEWSKDGKYLLINNGERYTNLILARYENNKWRWKNVAFKTGFRDNYAGIFFASIGANTPTSCWIAFSDRLMIDLVDIVSLEHKSIAPDEELNKAINWLDW